MTRTKNEEDLPSQFSNVIFGFTVFLISYIFETLRIWWNWQTRYFEVVVGQPVQVQVLLCAPLHQSKSFRPGTTTV